MPFISVYDWSLYATSLTQTELETSTHGNDPGQTGTNPYDPGNPTWTGVDFTYNGGAPTLIEVNDDDGFLEDGYVETGAAQTLGQDVTINGQDFFTGDVVELEFSLLNAAGDEVFIIRINGVNVGFAYADGNPPTNGEVFNANDTRDGDPLDSLDQTTGSEEPYTNILCFAADTPIEAEFGPVPVEALAVGDRVHTLDHGLQPVRWQRQVTHRWAAGPAKTKPVLIRAGALGQGLPARNLVVSPQHRMLVPDRGRSEGVLCPAVGLTRLTGVRQMKGRRRAELVHLLFDRHEVIFAAGAPTESFFPGRMAMQGLTPEQRVEVRAVLRAGPRDAPPMTPARAFLDVSTARLRFRGPRGPWQGHDLSWGAAPALAAE